MSSSRDHARSTEKATRDHSLAATKARHAATLMLSLPCDLCQWPAQVPQDALDSGVITGLLLCSACTEDNLATRQLETQP